MVKATINSPTRYSLKISKNFPKATNSCRSKSKNGDLTSRINKEHKKLRVLSQSLQRTPKKYTDLLQRGIINLELRKYDKALPDLTKALEVYDEYRIETEIIDVNDIEPLLYRAETYLRMNQEEKAEEDFNEVLCWYPLEPIVNGIRCAVNGEHREAVIEFSEAMTMECPVDLYTRRGKSYLALEMWKEAIEDFRRGSSMKNRDLIGFALDKLPEEEKPYAIGICNRILEENQNNKRILMKRAMLLENYKNKDAIRDYTRILELDSKCLFANKRRGLLHQKEGNFLKAIQDFTKHLETHKNDMAILRRKQQLCIKLKMYDAAVNDCSKIIDFEQGNCSMEW